MRGFKEKSFREKRNSTFPEHFSWAQLDAACIYAASQHGGREGLVISILQMGNLKVRLGERAQDYLAPAEQTG